MANTPAAARPFQSRAMAKPRLPLSLSSSRFFRSALIASRFRNYCPPVRHAMLWTARSGIWKRRLPGKRVWELANIQIVHSIETAFTISLDAPEKMAAAAQASNDAPFLKLKLGGDSLDLPRVEAVKGAAPAARLMVDANESWSPSHYREIVPALRGLGVELIEQPFPADADDVLETLDHPVPVCADESCHTTADLPRLVNRYDAINVKLDKTGGLTEALLLTERARERGFKILIGCMVCTSLGIAPARLLVGATDYADLDGPLLLAGDRHHRLLYEAGKIGLPSRELWG